MKRCGACGGFYDAEECPNEHDIEVTYPPLPPPPGMAGGLVVYDWPNSGPTICMIVNGPDENGTVGLMVIDENIRAHLDELKALRR